MIEDSSHHPSTNLSNWEFIVIMSVFIAITVVVVFTDHIDESAKSPSSYIRLDETEARLSRIEHRLNFINTKLERLDGLVAYSSARRTLEVTR